MRRLVYTSAATLVLGAVLIMAPTDQTTPQRRARNAVVVLLAVGALGKALYDTLYFERFRP